MSSHEFDTWLETQPLEDPTYQEQLLMMQEFEEHREATLKQQGAIDALQSLKVTLSMLILREDAEGDYFFGMLDALAVVKDNLDVVRGGVL